MKALKTNGKDYLLLLLLTLIVYWPLSLNLLSLKNDALVQYLAYRYHLSEAIQHGYMPYWSPYLYTGFPIHADIQGMVWNPIVLVLSFISRYNMTVLQWEVLIYLYLAAIGMYRLIRHFELSRNTAIVCAAAFLCCGYMTDSVSVIPWIPSAGFIPFVLLHFIKLLKAPALSNAIKFGGSLGLMFLCGYPSFFIFLNYILGISFLFWFFSQLKNQQKNIVIKTLGLLALSYLLFLLIVSPAIISFYEFLPYYSRGSGLSYERAATNPLVPFSLISYFLPNVANKATFLPTDLSMKNTYIGLFMFFFFLLSLSKLDSLKKLILAFTIFSLLFSLGDLLPVQKFSYYFIPLMDTFRHPGTIRIFTSIGMIWLAAFSLERYFNHEHRKPLQKMAYTVLGAMVALIVYFLFIDGEKSLLPQLSFDPSALKDLLYALSFKQYAVVVAILQTCFLAAFLLLENRKNFQKKVTTAFLILNVVVFAWMGLPFNVVSQYRTKEVNAYIDPFPDGYPKPDVRASVESEVISDSIPISVHGYHNFYNKKITIQDEIITPTLNTDYEAFLGNQQLRKELTGFPFVFITDALNQPVQDSIQIIHFTPNRFTFSVTAQQAGRLHLFQQYNHNWKAEVNNKKVVIGKSNIAFMYVAVPAGTSTVTWAYQPARVQTGIIISLATLLAIILYFVFRRKLKNKYA